jgi:hypothetical protein
MINQDKQILNEWREFNKSAKQQNISPELKAAIEKSDNIRLKIQRETNNGQRSINQSK